MNTEKPPPVPPRRKKHLVNSKINLSQNLTTPTTNNSVNYKNRKVRLSTPSVNKISNESLNSINVSHVNILESFKSNNNTSLNHDQARRKSDSILSTENIQLISSLPENLTNISIQINQKNIKDKTEKVECHIDENFQPINNSSSLLFTLKDFQDVISDSKFSNKSTKNIPRQFSLDDDEDFSLFQITTSNSPFEKYIGNWSVILEDKQLSNTFNKSNEFIFDDYIDRSKRLIYEKENLFINQNNNDEFVDLCGNKIPKVRFIIQAPSDSISDDECELSSVINDDDLVIEDSNQDSWETQSLSPLKITEIDDSESTENEVVICKINTPSIELESISSIKDEIDSIITLPQIEINNLQEKSEYLENKDNKIVNSNDIALDNNREIFFKNMLIDEKQEDKKNNSTCSIIATHLKSKAPLDISSIEKYQKIKSSSILNNNDVLSSSTSVKNNISLTSYSSGNIPKIPPKVPPKPFKKSQNIQQTNDYAKSQVLNELLCTFNSIKLKTIDDNNNSTNNNNNNSTNTNTNNNNNNSINSFDDVINIENNELKNINLSVGKKTEDKKYIKNSGINSVVNNLKNGIHDDIENNNNNNNNNDDNDDDDNNIDKNEILIFPIVKNKCAIDKNNLSSLCINNDNNNTNINDDNNNNNKNVNMVNMTDVNLSDDQSYCDKISVAIIPGRVRSFIENYEINVKKTIENSKINNKCQIVDKKKFNIKIGDEKKEDKYHNIKKSSLILTENQSSKNEEILKLSKNIVTTRFNNSIENQDKCVIDNKVNVTIDNISNNCDDVTRPLRIKKKAPNIPEINEENNEKKILINSKIIMSSSIKLIDDKQQLFKTNEDVKSISQNEMAGMDDIKKISGTSSLANQPEPYFLKTPYVFYLKM
ncbi:hypothetical protein HCN44_005154 [Aphidius gifuensis]|uniref:Uncharacterized protein n=1 Tax=Aphidius gifuensis TaxID=684658 RepID=A0A835CTZ9_APHGI|nr:hypothetical protein HCN44_005154 [Aphidius gifuensis]